MQAVILAGGFGSRLRPLTDTVPKPLLPLAQESVLLRLCRTLSQFGCTDATLTLCYRGAQIKERLGNLQYGIRLHYVEEKEPLGTAGSVKLAQPYLKEEPFLVISGDIFCDLDLSALFACYARKKRATTEPIAVLGLVRVEDPAEFGVAVCDTDDQIVRFLEKPSRAQSYADTVNAGIYYLDYALLDQIPPGRPFDFSCDLFPARMGKGLYGVRLAGRWCDIGDPTAFYEESMRLAGEEGRLTQGNLIGNQVFVHPTATVTESILSDGVQVGPFCKVHRAILWDHTVLESHAEVGEGAVLGEGCLLCNGAKAQANVRLSAHTVLPAQTVQEQGYRYQKNARNFLFDGGLHAKKIEFTPAFAQQLGQSIAECQKKEKEPCVAIFCADTPYCSLLCSALRCGLLFCGVDLTFCGEGYPSLASFTAKELGYLTLCLYEEENDMIRLSFYDKHGLYPNRVWERSLCAFFSTQVEETQTKIGICTAWEEAGARYRSALAQVAKDLSQTEIYCNHTSPARTLSSICKKAGATLSASPTALRLLLDEHGRNVSLLESTPIPFNCDFWHIVAILLVHHAIEAKGALPFPYTAPAHICQLAQNCGYTVVRYAECPSDRKEDAIRATVLDYPALTDALFAVTTLLALCKEKKKRVSELAKDLPSFATLARQVPTPSASPFRLLCSMGVADGDGVCLYDLTSLRQVRILPLGTHSLRLLCEAESMEAAQELFVHAKELLFKKAKQLEEKEGKDHAKKEV